MIGGKHGVNSNGHAAAPAEAEQQSGAAVTFDQSLLPSLAIASRRRGGTTRRGGSGQRGRGAADRSLWRTYETMIGAIGSQRGLRERLAAASDP